MKKIWEFFENMNEMAYVADMDTYEVLYMNKKALETYGLHSLDEIQGKKCYELLQGSSAPCSICNNHNLKEGFFREWHYYNPLLKKSLHLKDTMVTENGRRCRIELALDNSTQELQSNVIRNYENLETLANECFRIALKAPTPDQSIEIVLEYLGKTLKGDRTYIFEKNENGRDDNTYEWVANGVTPEKDNLQNVPPEVCEAWYQKFGENKNIIIKDLENIRESNPLQYEVLKVQDVHSLVVVPLYDDGKAIGFFGIDNPPVEILAYARNMLQIMAHFILSAIKRRELVRQLRKMSYIDRLTQLGNRFAMDEFVAHINPERSIGLVFCDVTGLKQVNDLEGHAAGDRLLQRAGDSLKRVFEDSGLFRIGGDEFLVLCPDIQETEWMEKMSALRADMREHDVTMAVGAVWKQDGRDGIDKLLSESEKKMYQDKASYYESAGVDRRR